MKLILVKLTSFLVIAPSPELGSGRNQVEMLPISLPDLPIPTRDQISTIRPEFLKNKQFPKIRKVSRLLAAERSYHMVRQTDPNAGCSLRILHTASARATSQDAVLPGGNVVDSRMFPSEKQTVAPPAVNKPPVLIKFPLSKKGRTHTCVCMYVRMYVSM